MGPPLEGAVVALIDTGATTTAISSRLAAKLNFQPVGKVPIHGVGGVQAHNSYLFKVGFVFTIPPSLRPPWLPPLAPGELTIQLNVLEKVIHGCEFHAEKANFDVLLGMDVISTGSLVVQGNQTFSFSF